MAASMKEIERHYMNRPMGTFGPGTDCLQAADADRSFEGIIGESDALRSVLEEVEIVASTGSTVLIQGETGTGKELIARAIHDLSSRRSRPLVKINCAAIPTGLLESELFGAEKKFRSDLYYRLNVFPISMPALRERSGDIPLLARYFVDKYARRMQRRIEWIPEETMAALARYPWPGNVRELENVIERAVILSRGPELEIPAKQLGLLEGAAADALYGSTFEAVAREHILRVLREAHWVIGGPTGAAARLGMKRSTLNSRMQKLGIARPV
jgi:transcriptional regulator with GAF, ATPase, and Fis domain